MWQGRLGPAEIDGNTILSRRLAQSREGGKVREPFVQPIVDDRSDAWGPE